MLPSPLSLEDQEEDEMLKRAFAMSLEEEDEVTKEELGSITEEEMLKRAFAMSLEEQ